MSNKKLYAVTTIYQEQGGRARQIINKRCRAFDKRVFRNGIWEFLNP